MPEQKPSGGMRYVVSACLAGVRCRFDGACKPDARVVRLVEQGLAVPVCPEMLGGLGVPRIACERRGPAVVSRDGRDFTRQYAEGARRALAIAQDFGAAAAVLKSKSPSCGHGLIYDGSFSRKLVKGSGMFAELLERHGIPIVTESEFGKGK